MNASLKGKLVAGFILTFLAGCAAGAFFALHQTRHWRPELGRHQHALHDRMRDRIKNQLNLTPEQLTKIEPILDRASGELQKIRTETAARVRQVMNQTNESIKPLLSDEQSAKLAQMQRPADHLKRGHRPLPDRRGRRPPLESPTPPEK